MSNVQAYSLWHSSPCDGASSDSSPGGSGLRAEHHPASDSTAVSSSCLRKTIKKDKKPVIAHRNYVPIFKNGP